MDVVIKTDVDSVLEIKVLMALEDCDEEEIVVSIDSSRKVYEDTVGVDLASAVVLNVLDRLDFVLVKGEIRVNSLGTTAVVVKKETEVSKRLLVS